MTPETAWGGVTAKGQGGSSDPNVLQLKESNRIKLLEPSARRWRQHGIQSPTDSEQFVSAVCPRGPDGRIPADCPLDRKPSGPDGKQLFPVSRRFATNVWDYESESVKVLIAGPQVFEEFDASAAVGLNPTESDWLIHKMGSGINTSYKLVRGNITDIPAAFKPDMLHDLDKYEQPDSPESIFEKLEKMGIDYDAIPMPTLTLEEAEQFAMPYGKHKGMTIEQLMEHEPDYVTYMYGVKKDGGQFGDMVFVAMQTVLEARGQVEPLDELQTAPPRPAAQDPAAPGPVDAGAAGQPVKLVPPGGGDPQEFSGDAVAALSAAGWLPFKEPEPEPTAELTLTDDTPVKVSIAGGAETEMAYGAAIQLMNSGAVSVAFSDPAVDASAQMRLGFNEGAPPKLPGDDEPVAVSVGGVETTLPFKAARPLIENGQAEPVGEDLKRAFAWLKDNPEPGPTTPASDSTETPAATAASYDPSQTSQREDGRWEHPDLPDKDYATKGAVTQALNRAKSAQPAAAATAGAGAPSGGSASGSGNGADPASSGKAAVLERCKSLLAQMPEIQSDFTKLIGIFKEVANKRNITDFTEAELVKLEERLQKELATA